MKTVTQKTKSQVIRKKVLQFLRENKSFTSVDIGNDIKAERGPSRAFIRNRDVSEWLRRNFMRVAYENRYVYNSTLIQVDGDIGLTMAYLYHPYSIPADSYLDRDQKAKSI